MAANTRAARWCLSDGFCEHSTRQHRLHEPLKCDKPQLSLLGNIILWTDEHQMCDSWHICLSLFTSIQTFPKIKPNGANQNSSSTSLCWCPYHCSFCPLFCVTPCQYECSLHLIDLWGVNRGRSVTSQRNGSQVFLRTCSVFEICLVPLCWEDIFALEPAAIQIFSERFHCPEAYLC